MHLGKIHKCATWQHLVGYASRLPTRDLPSGPLGFSLPNPGGHRNATTRMGVSNGSTWGQERKKKGSQIHPGQSFPAVSSGRSVSLLPLFAISAAGDGDPCVIRVEGELDRSDCPRLEHALQEAEASHAIRILLDLEELTFIDAAGLNVLVAAWRRSMTDSNRLQVTPGRGNVANMFHLTALDSVLPFARRPAALRDVPR